MAFTKATLKQAIQDYTENTETTFVSNLGNFIRAAEERIFKAVQLTEFKKNVTANMTSGNKFLPSPSDFLAPLSLQYTNSSGDSVFLDNKDVNFLQEFWPQGNSSTGEPRYYAIYDNDNFLIAPTPDSAYAVELHFMYRPQSLDAGLDSGITWLSDNAPFAMLYGSLLEAYIFMKGEQDVLQQYQQRFQEALLTLKQLGEAKETTDYYRTGTVTRPKQ